jgi:hypothetical protein
MPTTDLVSDLREGLSGIYPASLSARLWRHAILRFMAEPTSCSFCGSLWSRFARRGAHHYDDVHAPWGAGQPPVGVPWRNIEPTPPSAQALAHAATPDPATRCAAVGLRLQQAPLLPPPSSGRGRRLHWLHVPKAGSSFGTTIYQHACPRLPDDAHADDGAPIVSLTTRYPRRRRWCDKDALSGNGERVRIAEPVKVERDCATHAFSSDVARVLIRHVPRCSHPLRDELTHVGATCRVPYVSYSQRARATPLPRTARPHRRPPPPPIPPASLRVCCHRLRVQTRIRQQRRPAATHDLSRTRRVRREGRARVAQRLRVRQPVPS